MTSNGLRKMADEIKIGARGKGGEWPTLFEPICQALLHAADDMEYLFKENEKLHHAARLIHDRAGMVSGSLAMGECDAFCKEVGLEVWKWPVAVKPDWRRGHLNEGATP